MYVKLSFKEKTVTQCMNPGLLYMLATQPEIVDTLPENAVANKQVRIPDAPEMNDFFGPINACHYDYYYDCGDASKELVTKVLGLLSAALGGKLPQLEADITYFEDNQNMVVFVLDYALNELKRDKDISNIALLQKIKQAFVGELTRHEMKAMQALFGDEVNPEEMKQLFTLFAGLNNAPKADAKANEPSSPKLH